MFNEARVIINQVCFQFGILPLLLEDGRKTRTFAQCRQAIVKRLRKETTLSWNEIATLIGRKSGFRGAERRREKS